MKYICLLATMLLAGCAGPSKWQRGYAVGKHNAEFIALQNEAFLKIDLRECQTQLKFYRGMENLSLLDKKIREADNAGK